MNPNVLVFCPAHPKTGVHPLTLERLSGLTYPTFDLWISYGDNPHNGFNELTDGRLNILHNYNKARERFLAGKWDYMLTIEADMIPPLDVTERLVAINADVAYSLYVFRRSLKWSAYTTLELGWGTSISETPEIALDKFGKQVTVNGMGLGATLIKRKTLEAIHFRGYHGMSCDGWFALDIKDYGMRQVCDMGCVSGHIHENAVLWPSIETDNLIKARPL